ncbi:hypothetical protein [Dyella sp.]|uniref:hypothetical protein n=1 Tax=Dyella sp. TaxID=1869338 RepID=UPI002FD89B0F
MSSPKQERALRRTVEQLSHCSADDIEWVWSTLDAAQRQRLRPLLAEVRPDWRIEQQTDDHTVVADTPSSANQTPQQLPEFIRRLPSDLAKRVLACLEDTQRQTVVAQLPANLGNTRYADIRMTKRAQRSLRDAVYASANNMAAPPVSKQPAWRRLLQRRARR